MGSIPAIPLFHSTLWPRLCLPPARRLPRETAQRSFRPDNGNCDIRERQFLRARPRTLQPTFRTSRTFTAPACTRAIRQMPAASKTAGMIACRRSAWHLAGVRRCMRIQTTKAGRQTSARRTSRICNSCAARAPTTHSTTAPLRCGCSGGRLRTAHALQKSGSTP